LGHDAGLGQASAGRILIDSVVMARLDPQLSGSFLQALEREL
jgi:hypothetical protein